MRAFKKTPSTVVIIHEPNATDAKLLGQALTLAIKNYSLKWIHVDVPHPQTLDLNHIDGQMKYIVLEFLTDNQADQFINHPELAELL